MKIDGVQVADEPAAARISKAGLDKRNWRHLLVLLTCGSFVFGFAYGLAVGVRKLPPYDLIQSLKWRMGWGGYFDGGAFDRENVDPLQAKTDAASLITVRSSATAEGLRAQLATFIWGRVGFPRDLLPRQVDEGVRQDRLNSPQLARTDRIVHEMDYGVASVMHLYHPRQPNGALAIYHNGHGMDPPTLMERLLEQGYQVLEVHMPLYGPNPQPTVSSPRFGTIKLAFHDQLYVVDGEGLSPIRFFVEPVVVALNYMERTHGIRQAAMMGLSGGGWTTTLYAALDTRITKSFPVAGSLPMYLRTPLLKEYSEFEQVYPPLYRIANYLDLYVLGATGPGRQQVQILNQYDPCCFAGVRHRLYEGSVQQAVQETGAGRFEVFLDSSHVEHTLSPQAVERILATLKVR